MEIFRIIILQIFFKVENIKNSNTLNKISITKI